MPVAVVNALSSQRIGKRCVDFKPKTWCFSSVTALAMGRSLQRFALISSAKSGKHPIYRQKQTDNATKDPQEGLCAKGRGR